VRSGLELLLAAAKTAGVCERGDLVRDEAVRARPRVWLGSREAEEGLSIWCDTFPAACRACRSGKEAAATRTAQSARRDLGALGDVGIAWCARLHMDPRVYVSHARAVVQGVS
jgi:hypothetical protein